MRALQHTVGSGRGPHLGESRLLVSRFPVLPLGASSIPGDWMPGAQGEWLRFQAHRVPLKVEGC